MIDWIPRKMNEVEVSNLDRPEGASTIVVSEVLEVLGGPPGLRNNASCGHDAAEEKHELGCRSLQTSSRSEKICPAVR